MDKISIVIPCYNVEDTIERCIASIANQSYENFEAIFVDDGSTDDTACLIKKEIEGDSRMSYVYKTNGGLSSARNYGLERISGEYVCFVDSDDYLEEDYLKELYESLIENDSDISICYFNRVYEDKTLLNVVEGDYANLIRHPAAWNKMYRTALFKENAIEFPHGKWYEDLGTFPKLLMVSKKDVSIVRKPLYGYIQNSSSIMHTYDNRIFEMYDICEDLEDFARRHDIYEENLEKLEYINVYHVLVGTMYRSSFKDDFGTKTIRDIADYVRTKYPDWHKNRLIKDLPMFYRIYFKFLHFRCYNIIRIMLNLLNSRINVESL